MNPTENANVVNHFLKYLNSKKLLTIYVIVSRSYQIISAISHIM